MPLLFDGQKVGFDLTIPCSVYTFEDVVSKMKGWFKKWVFQKETYSNGEEHWQVRGWLIHRTSCVHLHKTIIPAVRGHWSLTCSTVHLGPKSFNYVMKEDTRVDGPWKDSDLIPDRPPMTWQLEQFMEYQLWPYQQFIFDNTQVNDMRSINIIYDPRGHCGKSLFAEYCEYQGVAFESPMIKEMEKLLGFLHSFPVAKCYLIDMPRSMKKDKMGDFYAGIETLKNGVLWDWRHEGKKKRFGRPNIYLFCNVLPVFSMLSNGRWRVHKINYEDMSLTEISAED